MNKNDEIFRSDGSGLNSIFNAKPIEQLKKIFDIFPSSVVIVDSEGQILYVNKRAMELYGIDYSGIDMAEQLSKVKALRPDGSIYHFEELPVTYSLRSGQVLRNVEAIIENINGSKYPININTAPIHNNQGEIIGAVGIFDDFLEYKQKVAERIESEEMLKKIAEDKYQMLFNSIDQGFFIIDIIFDENDKPIDMYFVEGNNAASKILGKDFTGMNLREIDRKYEDYWYQIFGNVAFTGQSIRMERYSNPDKKWFSFYIFRIGDEKSKRVCSILMDITDRKLNEEALRESDKRKTFLLKLSDLLRPLNVSNIIHSTVSQTVREYYDADRCYYCEIENDNVIIRGDGLRENLQSVSGRYQLSNQPNQADLMDCGKPIIVTNVNTMEPNDEEIRQLCLNMNIVSFLAIPVIKVGKLAGVLVIGQSIPRVWTDSETELAIEIADRAWAAVEHARAEEAVIKTRELIRKLEQIDKNKNIFISTLSHELRNPLAAIKSSINLLELSSNLENSAKAIDIINRQSNHLCRLVDDLLDVSRINENKIVLKSERLNLNKIIINIFEDYKRTYSERDIGLSMDISNESLWLEGDSVKLSQMITNLLNNALKFTQPGGNVKISLLRVDDNAIICVEDNGIGIESDLLPYLFEPFIQADKSLDRRNSGLGLGLTIVKGIAELHGGSANVYSEGIDKGTKFTLHLPIITQKKIEEAEEKLKKPALKENKQLKILVIEDNRDLAEITCQLIEFLGHKVEYSITGKEGLAKVKIINPDVVICDIGLPDINGYDVADKIRNELELKDIYLIVLSGYAREQDIEMAMKAGFNRHLAKPVDFTTLQNVLNNVK